MRPECELVSGESELTQVGKAGSQRPVMVRHDPQPGRGVEGVRQVLAEVFEHHDRLRAGDVSEPRQANPRPEDDEPGQMDGKIHELPPAVKKEFARYWPSPERDE